MKKKAPTKLAALRECSNEELEDIIAESSEAADKIRAQLDLRDDASEEWAVRARHALRRHNRAVSMAQHQLAKRVREERRQYSASVAECFLKLCRQELEHADFKELFEEAQRQADQLAGATD